MQFYLETLSIIVLSLAAFLLAFLIVLNLYLINRNGFYISVNCWFCNSWTKVLYHNRNSFDCPACSQYNGFKEDGSYNKIIEAQHNISFNKFATPKTEYYENGLCTYCNNNQQLKMFQLAKFTPINEEQYDVEIEHFRKQLEKVYKLCKQCEQVLKSTLNTQHSWIFGNRLKDLRRKGFSLINYTKSTKPLVKNSIFFRLIRYTLILSTVFILCHILNVRVIYPHFDLDLNKYLPKVFSPYKTILSDFCHITLKAINTFGAEMAHLNMYLQKSMKIHTTSITPVACMGVLLDLILSFGGRRPLIWKLNGIFGWIILIVTSSLPFSSIFTTYVSGPQIFASLTLIYNYMWSVPTELSRRNGKEFQVKKLPKPEDTAETSDEETDEEIPLLMNINSKIKTSRSSHLAYSPASQRINHSFSTAKSVTSTSELYNLTNSSSDLNSSLDNLHLGFNSPRCTSPIFSVSSLKRPILSPAKLKNITQNPWTAGGFWKHDVNVLSATVNATNLSRSSSQSSGFVSNHTQDINSSPFNSLPVSREPSLSGDVDRVSILSEPAYHFTPISPSVNSFNIAKSPQLYYKADNNTFYPVLGQNNMLFVQNGIPQQSFGNSSLRSYDTAANCQFPLKNLDNGGNASLRSFDDKTSRRFDSRTASSFDGGRVRSVPSPSLFGERPVSGLFKNLQTAESFRRPQC